MKPDFTQKLLEWNKTENTRQMPWKGESDPYRIWLSEIILQQTRVDQGLRYYMHFIKEFPTIRDLASASDDKIYKMWEGLGYYTRCRNLIDTARKITNDHNGIFPDNYEAIKALKGIGPYTAAAISSFAYNLPVAVVDGNVQRVIARYFGLSTPVDNPAGKKLFADMAQAMLDVEQPSIYNQAIMDFGAVICKPANPLCTICVQRVDCQAYLHGFVNKVPVKEKSIIKKSRWLYYFVVQQNNKVYVRQRKENDIWQQLYEFILMETDEPIEDPSVFYEFIHTITGRSTFCITGISKLFRQQLTHQSIHGKFIEVTLTGNAPSISGYKKLSSAQLKQLAFPGFINSFLASSAKRFTQG
jgi:A/G-specific adenine glycosylase